MSITRARDQMKQTILLFQSLGIEKKAIHVLINEAGIDLWPVWMDQDDSGSPDDVLAIVNVNTPMNRKLLDKYVNLKVISIAFTGYDCVDIDFCRERKIAVYNVPEYSTDSVAELTLANAISLLRGIPAANHDIRNGQWLSNGPGNELAGKTIGILGTGAIGIRVAQLFKAFKCNLVGWSRSRRSAFTVLGGRYVKSIRDVCSQCDILSIHLPLTRETTGIVGKAELANLPGHAYIINTARAAVVDQDALVEVLVANSIAGAAIDVFESEPISNQNRLLITKNTILTPHIGYFTMEALSRRAKIAVANLQRFFSNDSANRVI